MERHVLITGGNKGIGLACSRLFLTCGDRVTIVARHASDCELAGQERVKLVDFDLCRIEAIPELIASLPPVDVLINNAGVMYSLPYDQYPDQKREILLKLNLEAPVALMTALFPQMVARKQGRIVNIASIAGQIGHPDIWYGISKAGLINVTKSLAKQLGPHGILINAVAPGPVETDMLAVIPEPRKQAIKQAVYTGRFATAFEVAQTAFWLGSDSPEYLNGSCIDLNNGAFPR
ncbi:MAG: SDR family oxidoreductase [Desulfuromonadaceae bacterium]|nr:SDR family oxidoreductase [Desulfuromonadaceae bacterium]